MSLPAAGGYVPPPIVESELDALVWWVHERESVRKKKEAGLPKPWSDHDMFRSWRWCSVSRQSDRVSVELMTHWYSPGSPTTQLVAAAVGRLINWPEALLDATDGKPFEMRHLPNLRASLRARSDRGIKTFSAAYIVAPAGPGENKVDAVMNVVDAVHAQAGSIIRETLQDSWRALVEIKGLGSFLAGQMTADLAYLNAGAHWPDRFAWAPVGPGSARGMNLLRGRPSEAPISQSIFDIELRDFTETVTPRIAPIALELALGAQDFQSLLCEHFKHRRLVTGLGKLRSRYDGHAQLQGSLLI